MTMNDNHLPDDDVLRLVFGELDAARQAAVRKSVAEDAELAATVQGLEAAVVAVRAENVGHLSARFNDRLRQQTSDVFDHAQPETTCPTLVTRSLNTWRWIMRSPVSRAAAAAIFVLAIVGAALWFHGAATTPAFADFAVFIEPIRDAKNAKYKVTVEMEGLSADKERAIAKMLERIAAEKESFVPEFEKRLAAEVEKGLSAKTKERLSAEMKGLSAEMKERLSAEINEGRLSADMMNVVSAEMRRKLSAEMEKAERDAVAKMNELLPEGRSVTISEVMTLGATRKRTEWKKPGHSKVVTIITDRRQGKRLTLHHQTKKARVRTFVKKSEDTSPDEDIDQLAPPHKDIDPVPSLFAMALDGRYVDIRNIKLDSLGEKDIDGRRVIGFRLVLSDPASVMSLWGDPESGLPVRIEITTPKFPNAKTTVTDFKVNVAMDESLFSVEPPAGYEIIEDPPR